MITEVTSLKCLPAIERRARLKEIERLYPGFLKLRRQTTLLSLLFSGLLGFLFYSLRDQLKASFISILILILIIRLVDLWLERMFVLPFATLYLSKSAEQLMDVSHPNLHESKPTNQ